MTTNPTPAMGTNWLFFILAKAILELASGGLTAATRASLEDLVDTAAEGAE